MFVRNVLKLFFALAFCAPSKMGVVVLAASPTSSSVPIPKLLLKAMVVLPTIQAVYDFGQLLRAKARGRRTALGRKYAGRIRLHRV